MPPMTVAGPYGNFSPQVSKMMEQLSKGYYNFLPSEVFTPNVNLYETDNEYQMRQAVGAAVEAGIAIKSFERLIHDDLKVAYEAFVLVALMIKCGVTDEIFASLRDHKDERVKLALLHVLNAIKDERCGAKLDQLIQSANFSSNVITKMQDTIDSLRGVTAKITA